MGEGWAHHPGTFQGERQHFEGSEVGDQGEGGGNLSFPSFGARAYLTTRDSGLWQEVLLP